MAFWPIPNQTPPGETEYKVAARTGIQLASGHEEGSKALPRRRCAQMLKLYVRTRNMLARDEGATATEYGLLVAFIAFLIIVGVTFFGTELNNFFNRLGTTVSGWNPS